MGYHWAKTVELANLEIENLAKVLGFADSEDAADESIDQELDLRGVFHTNCMRISSPPRL